MKNKEKDNAALTAFTDMFKENRHYDNDLNELMLSSGMNNPGFKRTNHYKKY